MLSTCIRIVLSSSSICVSAFYCLYVYCLFLYSAYFLFLFLYMCPRPTLHMRTADLFWSGGGRKAAAKLLDEQQHAALC
jgi:hypothetical protein